jgi:hypothetical protein
MTSQPDNLACGLSSSCLVTGFVAALFIVFLAVFVIFSMVDNLIFIKTPSII